MNTLAATPRRRSGAISGKVLIAVGLALLCATPLLPRGCFDSDLTEPMASYVFAGAMFIPAAVCIPVALAVILWCAQKMVRGARLANVRVVLSCIVVPLPMLAVFAAITAAAPKLRDSDFRKVWPYAYPWVFLWAALGGMIVLSILAVLRLPPARKLPAVMLLSGAGWEAFSLFVLFWLKLEDLDYFGLWCYPAACALVAAGSALWLRAARGQVPAS